MQTKEEQGFLVGWNYKQISLFVVLLGLPNLLGMININTGWGFKIHFFQLAIFMAALIYGPKGGLLSGGVGSVYSAIMMGNPYIIGGNMILGFFLGWFVRRGWNPFVSVGAAFLVQLPWLVLTDYFLVGLPWGFIVKLVLALMVSNAIWIVGAYYLARRIKEYLR